MIVVFFFFSAASFWAWNSSWCSLRMPKPCLGSHDGGDHAPLFRLVVIQPVKKGLGVGVGGEDVKLADGHFARWFLRHDWGLGSNGAENWNKTLRVIKWEFGLVVWRFCW